MILQKITSRYCGMVASSERFAMVCNYTIGHLTRSFKTQKNNYNYEHIIN